MVTDLEMSLNEITPRMNYQDLAMDRLTAESQGCLLSTEVSSWADSENGVAIRKRKKSKEDTGKYETCFPL